MKIRAASARSPSSCRSMRDRWDGDPTAVSLLRLLHAGSSLAPAEISPEAIPLGVSSITVDGEPYADLRGHPFGSISDARIRQADLSCATLDRSARFGRGTQFDRCIARSLRVGEALLQCSMTSTALDGAVFQRAEIEGAAFSGCSFARASFRGARVLSVRFHDCDFSDVRWKGGRVHASTFTNVVFRRVTLERVEFSSCVFRGCTFDGVVGVTQTAANEFVDCAAPEVFAEMDALDTIATGSHVGLLRGRPRVPRDEAREMGAPWPSAHAETAPPGVDALRRWLDGDAVAPIARLAAAESLSTRQEWQAGGEYALLPYEQSLRGHAATAIARPLGRLRGVIRYSHEADLLRCVTCWSSSGERSGAVLVEATPTSRLYLHWEDEPGGTSQRWAAVTRAWSAGAFDPSNSVWLTVGRETSGWRRREYRQGAKDARVTVTDTNAAGSVVRTVELP